MLTVSGLLAHIVVMLCVCSALTVVNLLAGPRVWWSMAILVIWIALVIVHAIGVGSRSLLFTEDEPGSAPARPAQRQPDEPLGPVVPAWLTLPRRNTAPEASVPRSWKLPDDIPAEGWVSSSAPNGERPPTPQPADEKVPWRAATDIAWLRRPRPTDTDDDEPTTSKTASS